MADRTRAYVSRFALVALATCALLLAAIGPLSPGAQAAATVNCATSNLQTAINAAPAGSSLLVSGTCVGNFIITKSLTLTGPAVLDGNNTGTVLATFGPDVRLNNLTIQHGKSVAAGGISNGGGLSLSNVTVTQNSATSTFTSTQSSTVNCQAGCRLSITDQAFGNSGGGIFNLGKLTITSSTISNNTASGSATLTQTISTSCPSDCSEVMSNLALGNGGGGIANINGAVTLANSTISNNTASGSANLTQSISSTCTSNCTISQTNLAVAGAGGGILSIGGSLNVSSSTIRANIADLTTFQSSQSESVNCDSGCSTTQSNISEVGGAGVFNSGTSTFTSSTITQNAAQSFLSGGGLLNAFGGTMTVNSGQITANTASSGAGIFNLGTLTLNRPSITGNTATDSGGGVWNGATLTNNGATITGNTPDNCFGC